jgi:hypothetical protein
MIAVQTPSGLVAWCHIPRQIPVYIAMLYNSAPPQIIPDTMLSKVEMLEYNELQSQNIDGRFLEK